MLKNLLHLTLLTVAWKRYRSLIVSTLLLFLCFWLLGQLHDDYIRYSELNDDTGFLALSFYIKWSAYILAMLVYLLYNARFSLRVSSHKDLPGPAKKADMTQTQSAQRAKPDDPFAQIRQRGKLRSRADFVIEKTKPDD